MKENNPVKNYTIGEVSRLLNVKEHTIRYWETEFPALSPKKTEKGRRLYDLEDLKLLQKIKKLLYQDLYSIKGAVKELERGSEPPVDVKTSPSELTENERQEKTKKLENQNLDSLTAHQPLPGHEFSKKIHQEILLRVYQEMDELIKLWEGMRDHGI